MISAISASMMGERPLFIRSNFCLHGVNAYHLMSLFSKASRRHRSDVPQPKDADFHECRLRWVNLLLEELS